MTIDDNRYFTTVVGVYSNTMKTNFLLKFWFLTSFDQITLLQVNKEILLMDSFSLFLCFTAV